MPSWLRSLSPDCNIWWWCADQQQFGNFGGKGVQDVQSGKSKKIRAGQRMPDPIALV